MKKINKNIIPIYEMTVLHCFADPLPTGLILGKVRDEYGSVHLCSFRVLHQRGDIVHVTEGRLGFKEYRIVKSADGVYHIV